jgi:hypothetical protein
VKLPVTVDLAQLQEKDRISSKTRDRKCIAATVGWQEESIAPQFITVDDFGNGIETNAS